MANYYSKQFLRMLRNEIPVNEVITDLLMLKIRYDSGRLRFCCPLCCHYHTAINPETNLARCFECEQNFNPIDLVMAVEECNFLEAVEKLQIEFLRKKVWSAISG